MGQYDEFSDAAWSEMEDEADRLTEENRCQLEQRAKTDRETAIESMAVRLQLMSHREIAEILWREREHELNDPELAKATRLDGRAAINETELARLFADAASDYADDNAERVTVEDVADAAIEAAAEAEYEPELQS